MLIYLWTWAALLGLCLHSNQGYGFNFEELQETIILQGVKSRNDEALTYFFVAFQVQGGNKLGGENTDLSLSSKMETPLSQNFPQVERHFFRSATFDQSLLHLRLEMTSNTPRTTSSQNQSPAKSPLSKPQFPQKNGS